MGLQESHDIFNSYQHLKNIAAGQAYNRSLGRGEAEEENATRVMAARQPGALTTFFTNYLTSHGSGLDEVIQAFKTRFPNQIQYIEAEAAQVAPEKGVAEEAVLTAVFDQFDVEKARHEEVNEVTAPVKKRSGWAGGALKTSEGKEKLEISTGWASRTLKEETEEEKEKRRDDDDFSGAGQGY